MKKLLFVIPYLGGGGAERVLIDLMNTLNRGNNDLKYSFTLFTIGSGVLDDQLSQNIKHIKLINTDLASQRTISKIKIRLVTSILKSLSPQIMRRILNLFLKDTFDIEIAFLEGFPIKFVSQSSSKKIGWIHTNLNKFNYYSSKAYFKDKLEEMSAYSKMNKTVFVSDICKEGYLEYFGNIANLHVINNIINIDRIESLSKGNLDFNFKYICSIGRLSDEKGFDRLITAYDILKKQNEIGDIKLLIIGSGKLEADLKELVRKLNLESDIIFVPFTKNPYKYIKNSKFFISSSRVEGYPTVVMEALTLGRPVVVTDTGAAVILNKGEFGLIVENSLDGIKEGIQEMIGRNSQYVDKALMGRERLIKNNFEKLQKTMKLFEE